jgi:hypothetical protein
MSERQHDTESTSVIAALRELIEALDRRVPRVERAGEAQIARDAAALRQEAVNRIEELMRAGSNQAPESGPIPSTASDDGSPGV